MLSGVLVVDKPSTVTSHDVVQVVRRLARTRRVGHAGTLDPLATGVLVVLVGPATRLSRFAMHGEKRYACTLRLGEVTDTYDADGKTTERNPVDVDLDDIEAALPTFIGKIDQVPPMYAAVRVKGRKLYQLAREGKFVHREPRKVTIRAIHLLDWQSPELQLDVVCSSGTYIRSLAHDLGQQLGCGAHVGALRRLESQPFTIEQAWRLGDLELSYQRGVFAEALLPPKSALGQMPSVTASREQVQALRHGQSLELRKLEPMLQAHDSDGNLVAVLTRVSGNRYRPRPVLPPPEA